MNMWQCILLGIGLALIMQVYKVYKAKKVQKELDKVLRPQMEEQNNEGKK